MGEFRQCCRRHYEQDSGTHTVATIGGILNPPGMFLMVCKTCGNKRCPKATDCRLACTGSNEPGQVGSVYGQPDIPENERWLYESPEALAAVKRGIDDMKHGRVSLFDPKQGENLVAELTTSERLCEKLNRLSDDQRSDLAAALELVAWRNTPAMIEYSLKHIAAILDGPKQEGGEQ